MKDIDHDPDWENDLASIEPPPNFEKYLLRKGDLLMTGRGASNRTILFPGSSISVIPAANLAVLRSRGSASPEFLLWFLNSPSARASLKSKRAGSSVPFIPLDELRSLQIPLPPLETQRRIAAIHELSLEEEQLMAALAQKRRTLIEALLSQAAASDRPATTTSPHPLSL